MKKRLLAAVIAATMTLTTVVPASPVLPSNFYPNNGVVTQVAKAGSNWKITFTDPCGRMWAWMDTDGDWVKGDLIAVVMDNNGTPYYPKDDKVVSVRYTGLYRVFISIINRIMR